MDIWENVRSKYKVAASRIGTPYEEFGKNMLKLIDALQYSLKNEDLRIGTAVYTLLIGVHSNDYNIHLSWMEENIYKIHLTNQSLQSKMSIEEVIQAVPNLLIELSNDGKK